MILSRLQQLLALPGKPGRHDQPIRNPWDEHFELDRRFPRWLRRSNPIVRRHVRGFLKVELPEVSNLAKLLAAQIALVVLSLWFPAILEYVAIIGLVAFLVLPFALLIYGQSLFMITMTAAASLLEERQTQALDLLRVTPYSLHFILLSKVAASLWQQADRLGLVIAAAALLSLPPSILQHITDWPPAGEQLVSSVMVIAGLIVALLRIVLEPLMIAAVGVLAGSIWQTRAAAGVWALTLGLAYFGLINFARLIQVTWPLRFLVEMVLPLTLPLLITWGALRLAEYLLSRD